QVHSHFADERLHQPIEQALRCVGLRVPHAAYPPPRSGEPLGLLGKHPRHACRPPAPLRHLWLPPRHALSQSKPLASASRDSSLRKISPLDGPAAPQGCSGAVISPVGAREERSWVQPFLLPT